MMVETPRLYLRRFREEDAAPFAAYRSDPAAARYQTWNAPLSLDAALTSVRRFANGDPVKPGWFRYAIESKADQHLIGDIGVNLHSNMMQAEIGFTVAMPFQRQGFGSEAVRTVVRDLLERRGLHRVSAQCDARNRASWKLLECVEFQFEGLRPQFMRLKGEWVDIALFGLLAKATLLGGRTGGFKEQEPAQGNNAQRTPRRA
jgi:RimJ/RimL family protein N-acetyltransferase